MEQDAYESRHFCSGKVRTCPYDEFISLRLSRMIPAIMLPPLSVPKLMLISSASFGFSSRMVTSLLTVKRLVAAEEEI